MRVAPKVMLTDEQRVRLRRWSRGRTTPMRLVQRAKIVLLAAGGMQNIEIAEQLGIPATAGPECPRHRGPYGTMPPH